MKKYLVLVSTLLLLAACGGGNTPSDESLSSSTSSINRTNKTSETQDSSQQATTNSTTSTEDSSAESQLQQAYPNEQVPAVSAVGAQQNVSMAVREENNGWIVSYYNTESKLPLNDPQLQNQTPIAQFERLIYSSAEEARAAVAPSFDGGGQAVDLGFGITGYRQSGAGSSFLNWQEGNWNLGVQASNLNDEDPVPLAQQAVEYLETAFLPIPQDAGQISLSAVSSGYESNVVAWQVGNTVYKTMHIDPLSSLQMAVSMNQ
ncbi:hypothetical protein [Enterococcus sp. AZ109]|uniref:hypothetical protein n=1 Tax=Enterococcus sp. AZ109 TaxID=2774634 RepID=UPI003F68929D